ncbi:50S ribosome-binding GTPase [Candidatus Woesearchaeota archaeon]|nr:50S ribosome-binding GTPase [Candidatus Woesearchaeota archaeon]
MANDWKIVNDVRKEAEVLIEVLDSRLVEESRNEEIEEKVKKSGKPLVYVINKADLVEKTKLGRWKQKLKPCIFMSATKRMGTSFLRTEIMKRAPSGEFRVGVLGYPNTGKSSVINALKGRASAKTAPISGYTKGIQIIRVSKRMMLIDTPGVFPYKEKDEKKHALIAAKTFSDLKDPEEAATGIIQQFPIQVEHHYDIKHLSDPEEELEALAVKLKKLRKGGKPDTNAAARILLRDWQEGKIKR